MEWASTSVSKFTSGGTGRSNCSFPSVSRAIYRFLSNGEPKIFFCSTVRRASIIASHLGEGEIISFGRAPFDRLRHLRQGCLIPLVPPLPSPSPSPLTLHSYPLFPSPTPGSSLSLPHSWFLFLHPFLSPLQFWPPFLFFPLLLFLFSPFPSPPHPTKYDSTHEQFL